MSVVLINGQNYSWSSLNNFAFGVPVIGIAGLTYNIKQAKDLNYGTGIEPISWAPGNKTYDDNKITVYRDWWQSVINAAVNKDPLGGIAPFDWTISYGNLGQPLVTETLKSVMFLEDGLNANQGDTKFLIDIPFKFAGIQR